MKTALHDFESTSAPSATAGSVTAQLKQLAHGAPRALEDLMPLVYPQLEHIARIQLGRHRRSLTLETCALVHEAYLKMLGQNGLDLRDRGHFYAVTTLAMRQILVDQARRRLAAKRGGKDQGIPLDDAGADELMSLEDCDQILALDQALDQLESLDPRLRQVVEMRYFAGLQEKEIADALGVTDRTVQRLWKRARVWLRQALTAR